MFMDIFAYHGMAIPMYNFRKPNTPLNTWYAKALLHNLRITPKDVGRTLNVIGSICASNASGSIPNAIVILPTLLGVLPMKWGVLPLILGLIPTTFAALLMSLGLHPKSSAVLPVTNSLFDIDFVNNACV
jgi:hypothetical protein